jgi:hypothetical protein
LADLEAKILAFIDEWNEIAHPFNGPLYLSQGVRNFRPPGVEL